MNKKKILMITSFHQPDDVRIYKKELISLKEAGYDIDIIAPERWYTKKYLHPLNVIKIFKKSFTRDVQVYHTHELGSLAIGVALKILKRNKILIYDAHECQPSLMSHTIFNKVEKPAFIFLEITERIMLKFVDKLIVVSPSLKDYYSKYHNDIAVISNYPILFDDININQEKDKTIIYTGTVDNKRGAKELKEASSYIDPAHNEYKFKIVGKFTEEPNENIEVIDFVPFEEIHKHIAKSNIGLILFKGDYFNNRIGLPNKIFEYMACGIPIIASYLPEIKRIVQDANCGLLFNSDNTDQLIKHINFLIENPEIIKIMGMNGLEAVKTKYNWNEAEKVLLKMYEEL